MQRDKLKVLQGIIKVSLLLFFLIIARIGNTQNCEGLLIDSSNVLCTFNGSAANTTGILLKDTVSILYIDSVYVFVNAEAFNSSITEDCSALIKTVSFYEFNMNNKQVYLKEKNLFVTSNESLYFVDSYLSINNDRVMNIVNISDVSQTYCQIISRLLIQGVNFNNISFYNDRIVYSDLFSLHGMENEIFDTLYFDNKIIVSINSSINRQYFLVLLNGLMNKEDYDKDIPVKSSIYLFKDSKLLLAEKEIDYDLCNAMITNDGKEILFFKKNSALFDVYQYNIESGKKTFLFSCKNAILTN